MDFTVASNGISTGYYFFVDASISANMWFLIVLFLIGITKGALVSYFNYQLKNVLKADARERGLQLKKISKTLKFEIEKPRDPNQQKYILNGLTA